MTPASLLQAAFLGAPTQAERFIRLHTTFGADVLLAERLQVEEAIGPAEGTGLRIVVHALSLDVYLPIERLVGRPARVDLLTQQSRSALRPWHGHVTRVDRLGSDGGLARYRLVVEPWLAFLGHRQDARVFQNLTVRAIVEEVFAGHAGRGGPDPAWRWDLADAATYPQRSLCIQYHETDLAFVQRLLREEGLFHWFEHEATEGVGLGSHVLVIADHNGAFTPARQPLVRYTGSGAAFAEDSLTEWETSAHLRTARLAMASSDYRGIDMRLVNKQGLPAGGSARVDASELADVPGAYAYETRAQGERLAQRQMQAIDARRSRVKAAGSIRTAAPATTFVLADHPVHDGTDPDRDGFVVLKATHAARNNLSADVRAQVESLVGAIRHDQGEPRRQLSNETDEPLHHCRLTLQRASVPVRMAPLDDHGQPDPRLHPRPTVHGVQTAIVVGPRHGGAPGADIHTDRDHRIKVQFHWQRGSRSSHRLAPRDGCNAPASDASGTWVRVAESVAGANWGTHFTPRIGQEVLVAFIEGDIDRPVVIGSVYNGQGETDAEGNRIAAGNAGSSANAPAWFAGVMDPAATQPPGLQEHRHAAVHTGFKSQELGHSRQGDGGHNQLVFDDTPGAGRIEIASSSAQTRLQLGHLLNQQGNRHLQLRGHGLDLSTAAWGAVRAGAGLLLAAGSGQGSLSSRPQLDHREASTGLDAAQEHVHRLAVNAQLHGARLAGEPQVADTTGQEKGREAARELEAERALRNTAESLGARRSFTVGEGAKRDHDGGDVPAWSRPDLVIAAKAGIVAVTPAGSVYCSGGTVTLVAQHDLQVLAQAHHAVAAKEGLLLYTDGTLASADKPVGDTGIRLHAASGSVMSQSQQGATRLTADRAVEVVSTTCAVRVAAPKAILLTAAGAALDLRSDGITLMGPGKIEFRAAMKEIAGPATARAALQTLGSATDGRADPYDDRFTVVNEAGAPMARRRYRVVRQDGGVLAGVTDEKGRI